MNFNLLFFCDTWDWNVPGVFPKQLKYMTNIHHSSSPLPAGPGNNPTNRASFLQENTPDAPRVSTSAACSPKNNQLSSRNDQLLPERLNSEGTDDFDTDDTPPPKTIETGRACAGSNDHIQYSTNSDVSSDEKPPATREQRQLTMNRQTL